MAVGFELRHFNCLQRGLLSHSCIYTKGRRHKYHKYKLIIRNLRAKTQKSSENSWPLDTYSLYTQFKKHIICPRETNEEDLRNIKE